MVSPTQVLKFKHWEKHIELVASMSADTLCGRGPTRKAFVENLRIIANEMEKLIPELEKGES